MGRTVDSALVALVADFAHQLGDSLLPIDSNIDRLVMMAE